MIDKKAVNKRIVRVRRGSRDKLEDLVVIESPLTIYLNENELVTLLCTPQYLDALALGFLFSEGLIKTMEDVSSIKVDQAGSRIEVEMVEGAGLAEKLFGKRTITSGCGKGTTFYNVLDSLRSRPLEGKLMISPGQVLALLSSLQEKAELFKSTGGVHSAALADGEKILFFCEDIGRHNAVDKVIGRALQDGIDIADKIIVSSGRLSSEILLKAAKLKIQMLISRAAPTSLCIELAESLNITLVGFARGERLNIYSHEWRITDK